VAKRSPLAELVNIPKVNRDKQLKTGHAIVLTSSECSKEKEERKCVAEAEKQKRKYEWELKKRQRKEEMQCKKEEKAQRQQPKKQPRKQSYLKGKLCRQVGSKANKLGPTKGNQRAR